MPKSISILLGAGFSAPMGYPIGNKLNDLLLNCAGDDFFFHTDGTLVAVEKGKKPEMGYKNSYEISFELCMDLIRHFNIIKGYFDYEEFYDFILDDPHKLPEVIAIAKPYAGESGDTGQAVYRVMNIFNQLVSHYVRDGEGKRYYDDEGFISGYIFPGYSGILNYLKYLGTVYDVINIHTLNHDMFLERFRSSEWFADGLDDGFEELGSPYYGQLLVNGRVYNCRLQHYTGKYKGKYRLYKLHGSFDYGVYYTYHTGSLATPETYIKTRYGIGLSELYKERRDAEGKQYYELCHVNYHADFLTGTTSKIERYEEPLLFKKLFEIFRDNLRQADSLLIIGYGGKDTEINKMILETFNHSANRTYIIDPYAGERVIELKEKLGAKLITKQLEYISNKDFS